MVCPFCLHKKNDVYNSRSKTDGTVWRRRRCRECGKVFTTTEQFDPSGSWHVAKGKSNTPYVRAKLAMSILRACDHRTNHDTATWHLFARVEQKLLPIAVDNNQTVTTGQIIAAVSAILKRYDPAAYIKYISSHSPTMDAATLRRQLRG